MIIFWEDKVFCYTSNSIGFEIHPGRIIAGNKQHGIKRKTKKVVARKNKSY